MSFQRIENFIDFLVNACSKAMEIRVSSNNFHIMGQAKHLSGSPTMKCLRGSMWDALYHKLKKQTNKTYWKIYNPNDITQVYGSSIGNVTSSNNYWNEPEICNCEPRWNSPEHDCHYNNNCIRNSKVWNKWFQMI